MHFILVKEANINNDWTRYIFHFCVQYSMLLLRKLKVAKTSYFVIQTSWQSDEIKIKFLYKALFSMKFETFHWGEMISPLNYSLQIELKI